jgi:hypothetical protein
MRSSASAIAFVFDLSFVWHQHATFSYTSSSSVASFSSCAFMSFNKLITFVTGRFLSSRVVAAAACTATSRLTKSSIT